MAIPSAANPTLLSGRQAATTQPSRATRPVIVKQLLDYYGSPPTLKYVLNHSERLDRIFRAVTDPTRRHLLERLGHGPASVSTLAEPLEMSLAAVVQHLQVLQDAGLVSSEKAGRVRICQLVPEALRPAEEWLHARQTSWERRLDALGEVLAERTIHESEESQ